MTLEIAPQAPHSTSKPRAGNGSHADKAKSGSGTHAASGAENKAGGSSGANGAADTGAAGGAGFMAILSALADTTTATTVPADNGGSIAVDETDADGTAGAATALVLNGLGTVADTSGPDQALGNPAGIGAGLPGDAATAVQPGAINTLMPAQVSRPNAVIGSVPNSTDPRPPGAHLHSKGGKGAVTADLPGAGDVAAQAATTNTTNTNTGNGNLAGRAEQQTHMDFKMFVAMQEQRAAPEAKAVELTALSGLAKPEKPGNDRADALRTPTEVNYLAPQAAQGSSTYTVNGAADVTTQPDIQVAEQVTYWISQDVQNAELKLDGLGDKPVEVSISMNGNQAHIAFRSDEAQTRGVLEGAGTHLKDMLAREGVVLSGVSVGTSGSGGDPGQGDRQSRQGARQASVSVASGIKAIESGSRAPVGAGRSLDLFV